MAPPSPPEEEPLEEERTAQPARPNRPAAPAPAEPIAARTRARRPLSLKATFVRAFAFLAATAITTVAGRSLTTKQRRPTRPVMAQPSPPTPTVPARPRAISPRNAAARRYPHALLLYLAYPVTDEDTGAALEYRQLKRHPKLAPIWSNSYSNEMGRLCQGVGNGDKGPSNQRVKGNDTFRVTRHADIPKDRRKKIAHVRVVCEVRPNKADPNRVRITVAGNRICYPSDVGTSTTSLDLVKLMLNSVVSRPGAKFACFDAANFYLQTPEMDRYEYVRIKYDDIPQEFRDEYGLTPNSSLVHNGWVHFAVVRGAYGLPQSGKLANDLLRKRLNAAGYHETATTPGLWRHVWRPVQLVLIVDDFGVEYVGRKHADHLLGVLNQHYEMSEDWEGKKFAGIGIAWNYAARHNDRTCRLTMANYISDLLFREGHQTPAVPQLSPHKHREIVYGAKQQFSQAADNAAKLDKDGITRVQRIVGALLYYARAVDNKLLVALSAIGSQQAAATETTATAIEQVLDYVATYPDDGLIFRASSMHLAAHSDAGFNNETKGRSRNGAHIFLSEDENSPRWNGALLTLASIMKPVYLSINRW